MARKKADAPEKDEGTGETPQQKLHTRAMKRFKELEGYWSENRRLAVKDIEFRAGKHWPEDLKAKREKKARPCLTFDKVSQYIRQVVNDGRQNRPEIKYRPVDDKGDVKVAEAFQGITRHILTSSNADEAFDTGLDHAAGHGFGYFRVCTDYASEDAFEQDIFVKRIRNSLSVLLGPHQAADGSDAEDGFVIDDMSREEFVRLYPNAEKKDWNTDARSYADGWLTDLTVKVAEYWYKVTEQVQLFQLEDGTTATEEEYAKDTRPDKPKVLRKRPIYDTKVKFARLSGAEVLEEKDWAGKFIPIIPVYGTETDVNGKVIYSGLVRPAKDPALLYDFSRSAFAERVALAPKAPFVAAEGQVEGHPEWDTAHVENHAVLTYTPQEVNGTLLPRPDRIQASDVPAGFAQDAQMAEHDIQSAIGMFNASLGAPSNEKSGRAIIARQREGDMATFHYHDNLNRAVRYLGRILVDLIPKVYDNKRSIRIVDEMGGVSVAMVDPNMTVGYAMLPPADDAKPVPVFNLNAGRYDVAVTAGPSYTTKRQESAEAMLELARNNPEYWRTHGDLIVKSQDWPNAEEFAERTMALMPPELKAAIAQQEAQGDEDEGVDPQVAAIMESAQKAVSERDQQIEQMGQMLEQAKDAVLKAQEDAQAAKQKAEADAAAKEAEIGLKRAEVRVKEREVAVKEKEAQTKAVEARTKRMETILAKPPEGVELEEEDPQMWVEKDEFAQLMQAIGQMSAQLGVVGQTVEQLAEYADAAPEILRDANGQAYAVRKGGREMLIVRGPDGGAQGLQ